MLWVRSYWHFDEMAVSVRLSHGGIKLDLSSDGGGVSAVYIAELDNPYFKSGFSHFSRPPSRMHELPNFWMRHNFYVLKIRGDWSLLGVLLPHWLLAGLTAILPILFGIRLWRRRARKDRCPACGYNLTANTSGTCPECGAPVPSKPEAIA